MAWPELALYDPISIRWWPYISSIRFHSISFDSFLKNFKIYLKLLDCLSAKREAQARSNANEIYVPQCKEGSGDWEPTQCNGSAGICWCVSETGVELVNTQHRLWATQINCERERRFRQPLGSTNTSIVFNDDFLQCPPSDQREPCQSRTDFCADDNSCSRGQRCCFNGCQKVCRTPAKLGNCPAPFGISDCRNLCSEDRECPGNEKCCSNGCGKQCRLAEGGSTFASQLDSCTVSCKLYNTVLYSILK